MNHEETTFILATGNLKILFRINFTCIILVFEGISNKIKTIQINDDTKAKLKIW